MVAPALEALMTLMPNSLEGLPGALCGAMKREMDMVSAIVIPHCLEGNTR